MLILNAYYKLRLYTCRVFIISKFITAERNSSTQSINFILFRDIKLTDSYSNNMKI